MENATSNVVIAQPNDPVEWYHANCNKADMVCADNKFAVDGDVYPTTCHKCHGWSEFGKVRI